jgi:hypothetical protein
MTLTDLMRSSFRLIGVLREGQTFNQDDQADALFVLNAMLEQWSTERLNVFTIQPQTIVCNAGQQAYQWGAGAPDINAPRPQRITAANVVTTATGGPCELPLAVLNLDQWVDIRIKSTPSTIPTRIFLDDQWPNANLLVWPVPTQSIDIIAWVWQAIQTGFTDPSVTLSFPPGYAEAIRYNLACKLAPEWGRELRDDVIEEAMRTKAAIKRLNKPRLYLSCDAALTPAQGGVWNWLTGSTTGR